MALVISLTLLYGKVIYFAHLQFLYIFNFHIFSMISSGYIFIFYKM